MDTFPQAENKQKPAKVVEIRPKNGGGGSAPRRIIPIIPFDEIKLTTRRRYAIGGLLPRTGIVVVWGPPKSGKTFWVYDAVMHIALDWPYRGRKVHGGPVVYCAFEGQTGIEARTEAFRQKFLADDHGPVPFYLEPLTLNLVRECDNLIAAIKEKLNDKNPNAVVLDTLNRSMQGSESSDEDMTAYLQAADLIRETFDCLVIIIHHCGVDGTRPRGHTSITGTCEAQLSVKRDGANNVIVEVEYAKDGPQGEQIASKLEVVEVGLDEDGAAISSCVIRPVDDIGDKAGPSGPRLTPNQKTMFSILHRAGKPGLTTDEWNEQTRDAGIGEKRRADLHDIREALLDKGLIRQTTKGWTVKHA